MLAESCRPSTGEPGAPEQLLGTSDTTVVSPSPQSAYHSQLWVTFKDVLGSCESICGAWRAVRAALSDDEWAELMRSGGPLEKAAQLIEREHHSSHMGMCTSLLTPVEDVRRECAVSPHYALRSRTPPSVQQAAPNGCVLDA